MFTALEPLKPIGEDRKQLLCVHSIQGVPQLTVFGDRFYLKHVSQVAELAFSLQSFLEFQQGRVLKEHHSKSGHQAVMEPMIEFALLALIVNRKKVFTERLA